jgi:molybdate transport system ATP-binding protein
VFEIDVTARRGDRDVSARIAVPGRVVALFGRSGVGKTSLLDMVAGLLRPQSGRIAVAGEVLFDSAAGINLPPERRACGYVFQDSRLFPHLTVRDNLLYGSGRAPALLTLDDTCHFLGIAHLAHRMPATLSGGEAQRVAIGRALLSAPRFLLLDEPLSSLDRPRREEIMVVIERIRDELALPMLHVSHDRAEVDRLADAVVELD